jgi:hypothetical protein
VVILTTRRSVYGYATEQVANAIVCLMLAHACQRCIPMEFFFNIAFLVDFLVPSVFYLVVGAANRQLAGTR